MTTLDVPGARLYYETKGEGPLLLLIGSPMDSTAFTTLADAPEAPTGTETGAVMTGIAGV
jgi:hypothetical protein